MRKRKLHELRLLGCLAMITGLLSSSAPALAQCPTPITTSTLLTADCSGNIVVTGSNISLDCDGYTVTGTGTGIGILLSGVSLVVLENCDVTNFGVGVRLLSADKNDVRNNSATFNNSTISGFSLVDSHKNRLAGNTATNNSGRGFTIDSSSGNTLSDNTASNNGFRGFDILFSSSGNLFRNNVAACNGSAGWVVQLSAADNTFTKNKSIGSDFEGFAVFSSASGNKFDGNVANDNGSIGYRDSTVGSGTLGTDNSYNANRCLGNASVGSSPTGLCTPQKP